MKLLLIVFSFLFGGVLWTFTEYVLHRGWGHRPSWNPFSKEHLKHHADVMYFAPSWMKFAFAVGVLSTFGVAVFMLVGVYAFAGMVGFLVTYLYYEFIHRRVHTHGPMNAYGRWARKHHFHHHFRRPNMNEGVTTPFWDWVFGTLEIPDKVRVPRRQALPWMIDENGELWDKYKDDYELVGRPKSSKSKRHKTSATESASAKPSLVGA